MKQLYTGRNSRITVRDRQTPIDYTIRLTIMFDWYPVIGATGYGLYSLYVALAAIDNSLGIRQIGQHLDISPAAVQRNTTLLAFAGLIDIETGDYSHANAIIINDPPGCDPHRLQNLAQSVTLSETIQSPYFIEAVQLRIANWQPWRLIPKPENGHNINTTTNQGQIMDRLLALGVSRTDAARYWVEHADLLNGWLDWLEWKKEETPNYFKKSIASYLATVLLNKQAAPPIPVTIYENRCRACGVGIADEQIYCDTCRNTYGLKS